MLTPIDWHNRFLQQAGWTRLVRDYLFSRLPMREARRVLEVGTGTGVIAADLTTRTSAAITGVDINRSFLTLAKRNALGCLFSGGNALSLPFPQDCFDISVCHFLLLWVEDPLRVLREMKRVTRSGGWVLALAEPDYGGRIDYPMALMELGRFQIEALKRQGADPMIGRRLADLFLTTGLSKIETGLLGGQWQIPAPQESQSLEYQVIENDLRGGIPDNTLDGLLRINQEALRRGDRLLFVPTFYALGQVVL